MQQHPPRQRLSSNEPVSRKDWPAAAQAALAQDPRLYGQAAGEFYVIYAQLRADKLKLTDERLVIPQLLKPYPYALFVFSDKSQTNFHFVNVKWENKRLYRRIAVGPHERLRTAVERITMLDPQTIRWGSLRLHGTAHSGSARRRLRCSQGV